jgi:hypothetical protein
LEPEFFDPALLVLPLPVLVLSMVVVPSWVVRVVLVLLFLIWVGQDTAFEPGVTLTGSWPTSEAGGRLAAAPRLSTASKHTEPGDIDDGHWIWLSIWAGCACCDVVAGVAGAV